MKKVSGYGHWIVLVLIAISLVQSVYQWITNRGNLTAIDYSALGFGVVGFLAMLYLTAVVQKAKKKQI